MLHRRTLLMAGLATLAAPGNAHANSVSQQIDIGATVAGACGMGNPDDEIIELGDLTDPDGTLKGDLTSASASGSTIIPDAWCNTPHKLTMEATPMTLQAPPAYAQPSYMARKVTYWARLKNWSPMGAISLRPHGGSDQSENEFNSALAAQSGGLTLEISQLETLNQSNNEVSNLMLEVGDYKGTVTITLATNP